MANENPLPGDWTIAWTRDGNGGSPFYFSADYATSQWDRPTRTVPPPLPRLPQGSRAIVVDDGAGNGLPGDWTTAQHLGEGGAPRVFYWSYNLGAAQWERPTRRDAPPIYPLPGDWKRAMMPVPDCRVFYYSPAHRRTTFDAPLHAVPPPLPRLPRPGDDARAPPNFPPPMSRDGSPPGDWTTAETDDGRIFWWSGSLNAAQWARPDFPDAPPPFDELRRVRRPRPPAPPAAEPGNNAPDDEDDDEDYDDEEDEERAPVSVFCIRLPATICLHLVGTSAGALRPDSRR